MKSSITAWVTALRATAVALTLLVCLQPAWAQRVNFEQITDAGHGFSRSWVDVNNDGRDDYCVFTGGSAETLACYQSTGTGFTPMPVVSIGGWDKLRFWWIDLNGDGQVDLCRMMDTLFDGTVTVQCRVGPTFAASVSITLPASDSGTEPGLSDTRDLFWSDINQDGTSDLCYLHRTGVPNGRFVSYTYDLRCAPFVGGAFSALPSSGRVLKTGGDSLPPDDRDWARGFYDADGNGYPDYCRVDAGSSAAH